MSSETVSNRLLECQTQEDLDHSSDYYPIATRLALEPQYAPQTKARNWKKLDWEAVQTGAQGLRWLPTGEPTAALLDAYAEYLITFT